MADLEDLGKLGGQANVSESYQLNPTSVIVSVVFSLIFLLGTVGNSLVLAVLLRSGQVGYNTTNLFILNLSVADFSFIVFCVPFQATIYSLEDWVFGSFLCKVVHFFINLTMYASSFTLAAVSVDRYRRTWGQRKQHPTPHTHRHLHLQLQLGLPTAFKPQIMGVIRRETGKEPACLIKVIYKCHFQKEEIELLIRGIIR